MKSLELGDMHQTNFKIIEYEIGSFLYGTNIESSDRDYSGIFIAPINNYFGLSQISELNESIIDKDENKKNTKNAIDKKLYEIKVFFKLALQNNPNIIEQLFIPLSSATIHSHFITEKIFKNKKDFLHKGLYNRFIGYAKSQKKKMIIKLDNFDKLNELKNILENENPINSLNHFHDKLKSFIVDSDHIQIGDIKIPLGILNKKALKIINNRFSNLSNRITLINEYGYDTKFASHLIRLLLEGKDLLQYHEIEFPLKQADLIIDIKNGKYSLDEIINISDDLEKNMNIIFDESSLPEKPNYEKIENLLIEILNYHFYNFLKEELV